MILYTCICTCILKFHKFGKRKKIMIGNDKLRLYIRPLDVTLTIFVHKGCIYRNMRSLLCTKEEKVTIYLVYES